MTLDQFVLQPKAGIEYDKRNKDVTVSMSHVLQMLYELQEVGITRAHLDFDLEWRGALALGLFSTIAKKHGRRNKSLQTGGENGVATKQRPVASKSVVL